MCVLFCLPSCDSALFRTGFCAFCLRKRSFPDRVFGDQAHKPGPAVGLKFFPLSCRPASGRPGGKIFSGWGVWAACSSGCPAGKQDFSSSGFVAPTATSRPAIPTGQEPCPPEQTRLFLIRFCRAHSTFFGARRPSKPPDLRQPVSQKLDNRFGCPRRPSACQPAGTNKTFLIPVLSRTQHLFLFALPGPAQPLVSW